MREVEEITPMLTCATSPREVFNEEVLRYLSEGDAEFRSRLLAEIDYIAEFNGFKNEDYSAAKNETLARLAEYDSAPIRQNADFLACFKTLDAIQEKQAKWLIEGWVPEGQITLLAADGGVGKTTLWCNIIAALSSGKSCVLDKEGVTRTPLTVAFMTTEDSVSKKLKAKLREAGANERNIITPDFAGDKEGKLHNLKFGTADMEAFVRYYKPALCVFDPVQGFVPPTINMGSRNAMRDCMASLITLGEETGTTFLVVCHTNKRKGAAARDRISDSADLWDIARSVLMVGMTEESGIRYLSNEKNNYTAMQKTILFSIDDNAQVCVCGTTWKRDREYVQETLASISAPKREDCKEFILSTLSKCGGTAKTAELQQLALDEGYSQATIRRAKEALGKDERIRYLKTGNGTDGSWHITLSGSEFKRFEKERQNSAQRPF